MKIRNGFVSNSSSSSFCIFGICVGDDWFDGMTDEQYEIWKTLNLSHKCAISEWDENEYIGISVSNFPIDKTPNQVEEELLEQFKKLGVEAKGCSFIHDGGYNG